MIAKLQADNEVEDECGRLGGRISTLKALVCLDPEHVAVPFVDTKEVARSGNLEEVVGIECRRDPVQVCNCVVCRVSIGVVNIHPVGVLAGGSRPRQCVPPSSFRLDSVGTALEGDSDADHQDPFILRVEFAFDRGGGIFFVVNGSSDGVVRDTVLSSFERDMG